MSYKYSQYYQAEIKTSDNGIITVSVMHYGEYSFMNEAYDFLFEWIEENGYRIRNKSILSAHRNVHETYIRDCTNSQHKEEFQTKLEVEIEKK